MSIYRAYFAFIRLVLGILMLYYMVRVLIVYYCFLAEALMLYSSIPLP